MNRVIPPLERFCDKVVFAPSGCVEWTAARTYNGYGRFTLGHGRSVPAHRFAYEQFVGPVPDGMEMDHLCRNPACVNPKHLEPVTRKENVRRQPKTGRPHCKWGHLFTPENTRIDGRGYRQCRLCHTRPWRRLRAALKAAE